MKHHFRPAMVSFALLAAGFVLGGSLALLQGSQGQAAHTQAIHEVCDAARVLHEEGIIAWEGLEDLAPDNLVRQEAIWRQAARVIETRCEHVPTPHRQDGPPLPPTLTWRE